MKLSLGLLLFVAAPLVACAATPSNVASSDATEPGDNKSATTGTFATTKGGKAGACTSSGKEQCSGGGDEDCDGLIDCQDPDCSGVGSCPVCGAVDKPEAAPLALPDGNDGEGVPYESKLHFKGFAANQKLDKTTDLLSVCVKMEHSWLRDLEIKLISPDGKEVVLDDFRGRDGGEIHLGTPNKDDDASSPVPGVGAEYCWAADAKLPAMLDSPDAKRAEGLFADTVTLTPGTYSPAGSFDSLEGTTLNGDWTMRVTDRWSEDNGFIFGWSISFEPTLVADCSAPLVDSNLK
jgi:subtilisin-like proprotein convertase family protein